MFRHITIVNRCLLHSTSTLSLNVRSRPIFRAGSLVMGFSYRTSRVGSYLALYFILSVSCERGKVFSCVYSIAISDVNGIVMSDMRAYV